MDSDKRMRDAWLRQLDPKANLVGSKSCQGPQLSPGRSGRAGACVSPPRGVQSRESRGIKQRNLIGESGPMQADGQTTRVPGTKVAYRPSFVA